MSERQARYAASDPAFYRHGRIAEAPEIMRQEAPYPALLDGLVADLRYKPGWTVTLEDVDRGQGSKGLTLCVLLACEDSYHPGEQRRVMHYFPVPPAAYDRRSWRRWLLEQLGLVDLHERSEFFRLARESRLDAEHAIEDLDRPYAPSHGPGNDPYIVRELGTELDQRTSFRGEVKPA